MWCFGSAAERSKEDLLKTDINSIIFVEVRISEKKTLMLFRRSPSKFGDVLENSLRVLLQGYLEELVENSPGNVIQL